MVSLFTCCPLNRKCHVKEKSRWEKMTKRRHANKQLLCNYKSNYRKRQKILIAPLRRS